MSSLLKILAWLCIGLGGLHSAVTLIRLPAGSASGRSRQRGRPGHRGRRRSRAAWSDLRTSLTAVAVGLSLLADQWKAGTPKWWLAASPIFLIVTLNLGLWLTARVRRGRTGQRAEPS
jgi:hypothetical protein